jgi:hypothetical protein
MDAKSKIGLIVGVVVTPVLVFLAVVSGGAGHGDYFWARVFYPLLCWLMLFAGAGALVVPFVFLQYPFFGWFIGRCITKKQFIRLAVVLLVLQIIPMIFVLSHD